jgi:hypothetical protein
MQKQLFIIALFLIAIMIYKFHLSSQEVDEVMQLSEVSTPQNTPPLLPQAILKPKKKKKPSYAQLYDSETVDKIWAATIQVQLLRHAGILSKEHSKYFNQFSVACKKTICKLGLGIEGSEQTLQILTAELLYKMKQQGWILEITEVEETTSDNLISNNAIIYLFSPDR